MRWCEDHNLILNTSKTKKLIVHFRKKAAQHLPLSINGQVVERIPSFRFFSPTTHQSLLWDLNISLIVSKAHQRHYFFRQLRKSGVSYNGMTHFYQAVLESTLTSILSWYGNETSQDKQQLEKVVHRASKIIGCSLPTIASHYDTRIIRKARNISTDPYHTAHHLFNLLPSGKMYRATPGEHHASEIAPTYLQAIRHLNMA